MNSYLNLTSTLASMPDSETNIFFESDLNESVDSVHKTSLNDLCFGLSQFLSLAH